jgi:hypothetical protein
MIEEEIKRTRYNLMIHSYLYYKVDQPIISDVLFDEMSKRLVELQKTTQKIGFYDEAFQDWDGSTGYYLPVDERIMNKSFMLLKLVEKRK